jgi:type II secretory pathway predicted ATPase ExeA
VSLKFVQSASSRIDPAAGALSYETYFGLNEKAFSLTSDPRFVYDSPSHVAASQTLLAGIRRREGLLVMTGEIGTGKTTLCRTVLRDVGRTTYSSLVPDPFASREDLLKMLLIDFGVLSIEEVTSGPLRQASRTELGYLLSRFLDSLAADAFVVVVIDEAQNLSLPLIEETRILSDTFGARGRLQIVLVGQPELQAKLKSPEMRQVDQRVCGYHRLAPMSREAVAGYVQHRLRVAGCSQSQDRALFPPEVIDALHPRSGGVPRLINRICDRALHIACERQAHVVDREILNTALIEIGAATLSPTWDSIIFSTPAQPIAVKPAAPAAAAPAAAVPPTSTWLEPQVDHVQDFNQQVDRWVERDLGTPARSDRPLHEIFAEDVVDLPAPPPPAPDAARPPVARRKKQTPTINREWPRHVRSETYISRLSRQWLKRAAITVVALLFLNVVIAGIPLAADWVTPLDLPALPDPPARAMPAALAPAIGPY